MVISQRPSLMLRGVSLSAAQKVSEGKIIRARRNLLRIRTLLTLFDRRALNRITHCWLRGKSNVGQIVIGTGDAHRHLDPIPSAVRAGSKSGSKLCTNRGDCYTNSEHPAL